MAQIEKFKKIGVGLGLDPVLKKASRGETRDATLAHVNEVIDFIRKASKIEHANNAAAKAAGLVAGDLFRKTGTSELHIVHD
tara:strand:+ start:1548 stop:1793 length:246 start_codon:yes stop_codon:yes gene_type:complete